MPRLRPTQPGNSSVGRNHPSQHKVFNLGIQLPNNSISEELSRPPALLRGRRRSKETDTGLRLHCSSASPSEWLPGQLPIGRRPESRHPVCRSGCWRRRPQWCGSSTVRYLNVYTGIVLLRCRKEFYRLVWSALPFITYLENRGHHYPCFLNTLHVGGTIRTCQKFLIQYNRRQLLILLQNCTDEGEREAIQKSVTRSCLLEESSAGEELSDSGGEEAAEAME
ncbi:ribonuclease P/MRP protein subunit POP5 isoform X3 [Phocoena sinus]|uniref:ribonuclease P/MRP protein subunit POP5 isoform X3 n=1 Tax=Phocoena sinus TaxID=42100 RepID=UPI0013C40306|nr:ribonuclease P/MRP protein subunit POP5 isoform X3 [Phocoena sinus]